MIGGSLWEPFCGVEEGRGAAQRLVARAAPALFEAGRMKGGAAQRSN